MFLGRWTREPGQERVGNEAPVLLWESPGAVQGTKSPPAEGGAALTPRPSGPWDKRMRALTRTTPAASLVQHLQGSIPPLHFFFQSQSGNLHSCGRSTESFLPQWNRASKLSPVPKSWLLIYKVRLKQCLVRRALCGLKYKEH